MMDEIREYEEYTCDITKKNPRFNSNIFWQKNCEMRGLRRALTIISRKELGDRGYFSDECDDKEKIIDEVKDVLKRWTGFSDDIEDSWLKKYCTNVSEEINKELDWDTIRKNKEIAFNQSLYVDKNYQNNLLEVKYEKVIADAIYFGPLKRYYLVCKEGSIEKIKNQGKKLKSSQKDVLYKLISIYLIQKSYTGNRYNYINFAELGNWTQNKEVGKNSYFVIPKMSGKKKFEFNGEPIYDSQQNKAGNVSKICICPRYLKEADFQIIESSQFHGVPEGYTFYSDQGVGELQEKNFYETP